MTRLFTIILLIVLPLLAAAQDIHFSQFYASPLTLNPALTGFSEGNYRVAAIYRNQWASVTTPFKTYSISYDMRLLENTLDKDLFGVGIMFFNDKSGDASLGITSVQLSASYHKALQEDKSHYLAIGIQGGYMQKSVDLEGITFPDQYVPSQYQFDLSMANGENLSNTDFKHFDLQAGLLWHMQPAEKVGVFAGFAVHHLTRPKESFLSDDEQRLASRYTVHAGTKIQAAERIYITPNFLMMMQDKAREINLGTAIEYHLPTGDFPTIFSVGGWYRVKDAVIFSAGVDYRNIRVGFAYDVNTSGLNEVSDNKGAFEISFLYSGLMSLGKGPTSPFNVPCPRL